jgi:serine O-acetyltransferase
MTTTNSELLASQPHEDFHKKIVIAAKVNHKNLAFSSIKARLFFIIKSYLNKQLIQAFIKRLSSLPNGENVAITPYMLGVVEWPYIHNQWDIQTRLDKIAAHYEALSAIKSNLIHIDRTSSLQLIDFNKISENVTIVIDKARWFTREGELLINIFRKDLRVASVAFSLGVSGQDKVAYIGAIQGIHGGISTPESLEIFKLITKDFEGLRPRSLLLEVLKALLLKLEVSKIYAISEQHRHHRHRYFGNSKSTVFKNDYNPIWEEHGGVLDESTGFYEISIKPSIKEMEDIPSKKRSLYKRRNEIIHSLSAMINLQGIVEYENINKGVSSIKADWSREYKPFFAWGPSRSLLASIRSYQSHAGSRNPIKYMMKINAVLKHQFWSVVTGADIPINVKIGGGLLIPHPNGIVIHAGAEIGVNCLIFQQVTIGSKEGTRPPIIGGHVDIGAGAKIIGGIRIGDHAKIGANAVVLSDVPEGKTAIGIPAKII